MLIYHKTTENTVDLIQATHGFSNTNVEVHRSLPIDHRNRPVTHQEQLNDLDVGQVLVTGCTAVGFRYEGTVKDYSFFERYLNQKG